MNRTDYLSLAAIVVSLLGALAGWASVAFARRAASESRRQRAEAADEREFVRSHALSVDVTWRTMGEHGYAQRYVEPMLTCINTSAVWTFRSIKIRLVGIDGDSSAIVTEWAPRAFSLRALLPEESHAWPLAPAGTGVIYVPDDAEALTPHWEAEYTDDYGDRWLRTSVGTVARVEGRHPNPDEG